MRHLFFHGLMGIASIAVTMGVDAVFSGVGSRVIRVAHLVRVANNHNYYSL